MTNNSGFTVAEMLAALIVLALSMLAVGDLISIIARTWAQTHSDLNSIVSLLETKQEETQIQPASGQQSLTITNGSIILDNGQALILQKTEIEAEFDCIYDLVGKRCR